MKNLINKVRHHGKKITIYLKSQPKWVVRCMFGIWAILWLVLSIHTHPIGWTNAQSIECPKGQYLATWDVCITNEKDIVIQATATESGQIVTINKYFANDYTVDRWDGTTGEWATWWWIIENIISHTTHTYSATWTYNITLSLSWADRWTFREMWWEISYTEPLVPVSWTTVTDVQIIYMPSLTEWFWDSAEVPGNRFFSWFNNSWAITSLPEWSFNTSQITTAGDLFFFCFNCNWKLTSLPEWSFNTSNISGAVGDNFFSYFNNYWQLTSLPIWSFNTSQITTAWNNFFSRFDYSWALTSLPDWSFNISNISGTVGGGFFSYFNTYWQLTSLPANSFDTSNITSAGDSFFVAFNSKWALTSLPDWSFNISQITTAWDLFFTMFNSRWALTSLPVESFDTSNITSAWFDFFQAFNYNWKLTSLPEWSFNTSNIKSAWENFFSNFSSNWALTSLPDSFKLNSVWSQSVSWYQNAFNSKFTLNKNVSDLVSWVTAPLDDRNVFSDNQPWRCGVDSNWLVEQYNACSITYNSNWGSEIANHKKKYEANTTWVVAWDGIETPTRTGYAFSGWYTAEQWWDLVDIVVFPNMDDGTLYAQWIDTTPPNCDVKYSITWLTNQDVTATLTCDDEDINVTNNGGRVEYTFTGNWTHTFEFQDLAGNTGSAVAEVTWIDKVKPTCDIIYSTTWATTWNVVATLTGCIETITWTETQHTFTGNWTYIFNFQDLAGNTGSTEAAVTWIGEYTGVYEIKSGQQMINLYNQGKAITCNVVYSWDNGHQTNTMYIKSWVINENLMIITWNTRTMLYSLEKDWYIYSWWDMYLDWIGFYIPYELDVYEELKWVDNNIKSGAIITCTTWVEEDSVFDLPDWVDFFNIDTYYIDSWVYFIIDAKETAKTWENIDFTITVMKDGKRFKNFLWYVLIDVIDEDWDLLDKNTYEAPGYWYYYFASSDKWKKTFSNWLKINKTWDYYIRVNSLQEWEGFFPISIKWKNDPTLTWNYFKITVNSKANPWEYTTFTVRAMKDWISYSNYTGTVIFTLSNKDWGLINKRNYTFSNSWRYTFEASDLWRKIFYSWLKINETWTYILEVNWLNDNFKWSTTINVWKSHGSAEFKYDTLKFNPKYSDEMNEAYQYARYYNITTKDSIKDADMYSGLNRIAMAKMLTNYAENVLGKDNFNTGRNCSFSDVSNSLDKDYDYWVTKACQLWIMWVNMPNNKFYPNWWVTRAEFATALSRLLYWTKDWTEKYYSTHITKLRREWIITNTDPALWELRGYVMLMLKRVAEK